MNNFLVLAHPDENSFQASLFKELIVSLKKKGEETVSANLYKEQFPPLLTTNEIARGSSTESQIINHQKNLTQCDRLFLFYPDWWGMPPAILKGWLDRVLSSGTAFEWEGEDFLEKKWVPLLTKLEVIIFISADSKLDVDWLTKLWNRGIFSKCGASVSLRIIDQLREKGYSEIKQWTEDQKASL